MDTSETLVGRIRGAFAVIRGEAHAVTREDWILLRQEAAQLRLEWNDTLEKIHKWAGREAKREERALKRLAASPEGQGAAAPSMAVDPYTGRPLGHVLPE